MQTHTVTGGGGLKLHVRDWGPTDAPAILFLHGWSQHHLCWGKQTGSSLADDCRVVAADLRGHGQSEAPLAAEAYTTGALWADDVAGIIASLGLKTPILVGWSYGGFVIGDYLRKYGDGALGGVNLVCGAVAIGPAYFRDLIGPDFLDLAPLACSEDQVQALSAIQDFVHRCLAVPVSAREFELAVGWNMLTHPQVRANLIQRDDDFRPEYQALNKPLLVTYGSADRVVLPAMAKAVQDARPDCRMSEYVGAAHAPFMEDAARFNAELAAFAREAWGRA